MSAVVLCVVLGVSGHAFADKVRTNQEAKLFAKPGEQEKVILKLKEGQAMTLLSEDGRWIKVRVQGRTGYVTRTKVDMPEGAQIARNTRRRPFVDGRGTKRGFGGEEGPGDRVGADAVGDNVQKPDDDDADKGDKDKADKGDKDKADKGKKPKAKPVDDDDEEDVKVDKGKKPVAKPAAKGAKPKADDDDDDDTKADKGKKPAAKPAAKPTTKGKDDDIKASDDDDDDDSADAKGSKGDKGDKGDDKSDDKADDKSDDDRKVAHVSEKSSVYNDPTAESDESFVAKPADVLYPDEVKGKWTFVSSEEGDAGWIESSKLDVGGGGGGMTTRVIDLTARLGLTFISQSLASAGGTGTFDKYTDSTSTAGITLGGTILYPYKKKYVLGADLQYMYGSTLSTVGVQLPMTAGMQTSGFALTDFKLRGMAGYDFHKSNGMVFYGLLGVRYEAIQIHDFNDMTKNTALMPSESYAGMTLGLALAIPRLTDKIGAAIGIDAELIDLGVSQTKNLQDGASPSASAYLIGAVFNYRWRPEYDFRLSYDLVLTSYDFGAPVMTSARAHTGTDTTRSDMFNTLMFGIVRKL